MRLLRGPYLAVCVLLVELVHVDGRKTSSGGRGLFSKSKAPKTPTAGGYGYPRATGGGGGHNYAMPTSYKKPSKGFGMAKSVLAGLAAGYVGYKLTKGISHMMYNGVNYYPGNNYYPGLSSPSKIRCEYHLSDEESNIFNITLDNSTRATTLIYECDAHTQYCCDMQCCSNKGYGAAGTVGGSNWVAVGLGLLVTLLFIGCIGYVAFKFSRRILDCFLPDRSGGDQFEPVNTGYAYPPGQSAASQPPSNYAYPPGGGYPYPPGYPPNVGQSGYYQPQQQTGYPMQPGGYPVQPNNPVYPPEQPPPYGFKS